jgi:hypothetical protein
MDVEKHLSGLTVDQGKVQRLFRNLVLAYQRHDRRKKTVEAVQQQISKAKEAAVKRAPKRVVEQEMATLQEMISSILDKEKALLSQQREETRMLLDLRARLDDMERRVLQQGQLQPAMGAMRELHAINDALQRISAKLDDEARRLDQLRMGEATETAAMKALASKEDIAARKIMEIEAQLRLIERKHRQLADKGYSKKQLAKLRSLIERHKKKLAALKKKG